jgi:SAM-dependent methyltransferase
MGLSNSGSLALMVSIGHRTGLFDTMASLPPATSQEIADNATLDERHVREWLAAMATGRIVEYDPGDKTFVLPPEYASCLTRAAGTANTAVGFQLLSTFGSVEDQIVECFRHGGGLPASAYRRYEAIRAEIRWAHFDAALLDETLPMVPGLPNLLRQGIDVADVGCGYGHALNIMAEAFPASRFAGWDASGTSLSAARAEARRKHLTNIRFEQGDAATVDRRGQFDLITTWDAVGAHSRPDDLLAAIARALRPDGTYLCVEVGASSNLGDNLAIPWAPAIYAASCMHCVAVSLSSGGTGLGAMWGQQKARELLAAAGFSSVVVKKAPSDPLNNYYIAMKGRGPDANPAQGRERGGDASTGLSGSSGKNEPRQQLTEVGPHGPTS